MNYLLQLYLKQNILRKLGVFESVKLELFVMQTMQLHHLKNALNRLQQQRFLPS